MEPQKDQDQQQSKPFKGLEFSIDDNHIKKSVTSQRSFAYTYTSHNSAQEKLNLFESCLYSNTSEVDMSSESHGNEDHMKFVDKLVQDKVCEPLAEAQHFMHRNDGPYLPLTISMYRSMAFKAFKRYVAENMDTGNLLEAKTFNLQALSSHFCQKVDLEILDTQYFPVLSGQYHRLLQTHHQKLPTSKLSANIDLIRQSPQYGRLLEVISQWFALMEMCEDLVSRVDTYGISQYIDQDAAIDKLKKNWEVKDGGLNEIQSFDKGAMVAQGYFKSCLCSMFNYASDVLYKVGLVGAAQGAISRYLLGYATLHPGYFVSALMSSIFIRYQSSEMHKSGLLSEIEQITDHFTVVTSNLHNQYMACSQCVAVSFMEKDTQKVRQVIHALIEGHNKSNQGTLQKYFDKRDFKMDNLNTYDEAGEWVNIEKQESI